MRKNRHGFTLIEIIVSIAIASIVLLIAGSMILSSTKFMGTTVETDLNKRKIDSTIDFIRGEIIYSTDVRFVKEDSQYAPNYQKDNNWHYIYIKDGYLYHDGQKVFGEEFYNSDIFSVDIKGNYENKQRIDMKYSLLDYHKENVYSSRDTVMFMNLSVSEDIQKQALYTADYYELSYNGYWLFYNKKYTEPVIENPKEGDGTVHDQLLSMALGTNRWFYSTSYFYRFGDRVFHNGYWWMYNATTNSGSDVPGTSSSFWKRLTSEWTEQSRYSIGDVIIFEGKYYRRIVDASWNAKPTDQWNKQWEEISKEVAQETVYNIPDNEYVAYDKKTVISKLNNIDLDKIPTYIPENNNSYHVFYNETPTKATDFVKIKDQVVTGDYYHYYYRVFNNDAKPGEKSNGFFGWQEIKIDYDENSAYVVGDSVLSVANNGALKSHFEVQMDILTEQTIQNIKNKLGSQYTDDLLYSNYLNPGGEFNFTNQFVWKKLY